VFKLNVVFRVDSSWTVGIGHVMRCLTLAKKLSALGVHCCFICRDHAGNIALQISKMGFKVFLMPIYEELALKHEPDSHVPVAYRDWVGAPFHIEVVEVTNILKEMNVDLLVVDHYGFDFDWESSLRSYCTKLMAIDDLGRPHNCDILLDQNYGRVEQDYADLTPSFCKILAGPEYALLREEFSILRRSILDCRNEGKINSILVSMGGMDENNVTSKVLCALKGSGLKGEITIRVVMGPRAPWIENVKKIASEMPFKTTVYVNVERMGELMAESDIAISGGGSTTWELFCVGLPTIVLILAENQREVIRDLAEKKLVLLVEQNEEFNKNLINQVSKLDKNLGLRKLIINNEINIVDGLGCERVVNIILGNGLFTENYNAVNKNRKLL